jgi:hypothetical protein
MLLFCCDPSDHRQTDADYRAEAEADGRLGIPHALVSFEALVHDHDPARAIRRVPVQAAPVLAVYRGWMLTPEQYRLQYEALAGKGVRLLNDPAAYRHCHYLLARVISGHQAAHAPIRLDYDQ